MLTLYYRPTCPFCQRVLGEVEDMGLRMDLKDISSDPLLRAELIERGGKQQVPYLVDSETAVEMYESADIIDYLMHTYRNQMTAPVTSFNGVRIHQSDETCESCQ